MRMLPEVLIVGAVGAVLVVTCVSPANALVIEDFSTVPFTPTGYYNDGPGTEAPSWDADSVVGNGSQLDIFAQSTGGLWNEVLIATGAETQLVVNFSINTGNVAQQFNVILRDADGTDGLAVIDMAGLAEGPHMATFDLASLAPGPFNSPGADSVFTYSSGLIRYDIQGNFSNYPDGEPTAISVHSISTVIPEPTSLFLVGIACVAALGMRGRRRVE